MLQVIFSGLRAHLARFVGTAIAVILGVGFIGGTLVFNDTATVAFYDTFARTAKGIDAVAVGKPDPLTAEQLTAVQKLSTVDGVAGRMVVSLPMLDRRGKLLTNFG